MKRSLQLILSIFFCTVWLLLAKGCKESRKEVSSVQTASAQTIDTAIVRKRLEAHRTLNLSNFPEKHDTLRKIISEAIALGYNDEACILLKDFARYHADQGNFDSTLYYFEQASSYCNKPLVDKTLPASFLSEFGAFYHSLRSDYVAANNSYYEALKYLKDNDLTNNELTIGLYLYLFATQEELGHPGQALMYLKEAESLAVNLNSYQALIPVRTNLGNYYAERGDYQKAREYFDLAVEDVKQHWGPNWDPNIQMSAIVGKASVLTRTGEAENAIPLLKKAIEIAQNKGIIYSEVVAQIELGKAYNMLGRFQETVQLVTQALQAQGQEFNWYKEEGYRVLMEAYEGLGQYKQALEYQRKLNEFNDSLANQETNIALNELEIKFQTANKDKEIASKKLLIEKQKNKLSRKNTLIAGISGVAVLALIITIMLYKNAAQKQKFHQLEIKNLRRQQEINILRSTMKGEEQERKRLSRELHDGIGSMLSSAIMRVSLLKKQLPQSVTTKDFDDVLSILQETGTEVRKTAHNIMPDIVERQSLYDAVKSYCENITRGSSLEVDVQFYGDSSEFSSHCKLVIYRIIQELIHNIVKHSQATYTIVQGVFNDDTFTLTVEDNGIGFDPTKAKNGMGLKNVESRVKSLFGDFQIDSAPGKGTTIYMEFDCRQLKQEVPSEK